MRIGLKGRLFLISLALILSVGATTYVIWILNCGDTSKKRRGSIYCDPQAWASQIPEGEAYISRAQALKKVPVHKYGFLVERAVFLRIQNRANGTGVSVCENLKGQQSIFITRSSSGAPEAVFAITSVTMGDTDRWLILGDGPDVIAASLARMRVVLSVSGGIAILVSSILIFFGVRILSGRLESILTEFQLLRAATR